jgi:lipopolysaccharide export LptBFGC system permease protein LptF
MVEDETQAMQRNVEKDLFEEQSKVLDRFYSLIILTFTAFGFSITALTFIFGRGGTSFREAFSSYHVSFSFFCLFMAFLISIINVLAIFHHRRLVRRGDMIGYREGNELVRNNLKLYIDISRQKNYYAIAITFIALGLTSLLNNFSQHRGISLVLTAGFVVIVMLLIGNYRRYLS